MYPLLALTHEHLKMKVHTGNCHSTDAMRQRHLCQMVPEKVGLKAMQRDGMDYEFTVVLDIDLKHHVQASKDRTGLFMGRPEFTITPKVGQAILNWCNLNPQSNIIQPQTPQNYGNSAPTPSR